jgi:hypothetical protein
MRCPDLAEFRPDLPVELMELPVPPFCTVLDFLLSLASILR